MKEELLQGVDAARVERGAAEVEVVGQVVVGVEAGCHDDVEIDLLGHLLDELDVTAEPDHGQVHDRVDPRLRQLPEPIYGLCDAGISVPTCRPVGRHFGREDEDVLVHEGRSEHVGCHRSAHRVHLTHDPSVPSPCALAWCS